MTFKVHFTTEEKARAMGATHWSEPPVDEGDAALVVLLRDDGEGACPECGRSGHLWQPINQEGGPGPACAACLAGLGWSMPRPIVGPLPTHVRL